MDGGAELVAGLDGPGDARRVLGVSGGLDGGQTGGGAAQEYGGAGCLVRADRLAGEPTRTSAYPSAFTSPTLMDWPNMSPFSAVPGTPAVSWW